MSPTDGTPDWHEVFLDPQVIEEIRTRLLTTAGIHAEPSLLQALVHASAPVIASVMRAYLHTSVRSLFFPMPLPPASVHFRSEEEHQDPDEDEDEDEVLFGYPARFTSQGWWDDGATLTAERQDDDGPSDGEVTEAVDTFLALALGGYPGLTGERVRYNGRPISEAVEDHPYSNYLDQVDTGKILAPDGSVLAVIRAMAPVGLGGRGLNMISNINANTGLGRVVTESVLDLLKKSGMVDWPGGEVVGLTNVGLFVAEGLSERGWEVD